MKNLFVVTILIVSVLLSACKSNTSQNQIETNDSTAVAGTDTELITDEETILPDKDREVWKDFGGTYFFWNSEEGSSVVLEFPLPDDEQIVKFNYKDYSLVATVDEATGKIIAKDDNGKVAFKGYVYDGGNTIKGLFYGKLLEAMGSGD